jgi:hypothetical protein
MRKITSVESIPEINELIMERLKKDLILDYSLWVEEALKPLGDRVGVMNITIENFKLKLNKLIEYAIQNQPGKAPPVGDGHSRD